MILYYFFIVIICHIVNSQNETDTTTSPPITTTEFYSTTTLPPNTYIPTETPTWKPSGLPTRPPSVAPTIKVPPGKKFEVTLFVPLFGTIPEGFEESVDLLVTLCEDAMGIEITETVTCIVENIKKFLTERDERRRILAEAYGIVERRILAETYDSVEIEFRIVIADPKTFNTFKNSIETGEFGAEFEQGLSDNFEDIQVNQTSISYSQKFGDGEDFIGITEPTFGEKIESPYILLGVVCILVGTVWLLFLRSNIEYKPPTYFTQQSIGGDGVGNTIGNNAVEMHQIASEASE